MLGSGGKRKVFRRCRELRTAMELMRHSDIRLTTATYQHLELADTAEAVNRLPAVNSVRETWTHATGS